MENFQLNKKTVSRLDDQEMSKVKGGICIKSTRRDCVVRIKVTFSATR